LLGAYHPAKGVLLPRRCTIQIPAYDVKQHLEAGELVEVMPGHRAELMPMTLLYPHRQHLSHRLQVFADWLETLLKDKLL
ncbi:LysR substrate-binding domain-containing protein, partial [Caulobacter sp. CCH9-E1]|uniref:LysR substrate-binding domain-containing protein n=1 Tax=Caulobacter sp. CCH9-E1 TaxID=1768768 RepID=UPI000B2DE9B6